MDIIYILQVLEYTISPSIEHIRLRSPYE